MNKKSSAADARDVSIKFSLVKRQFSRSIASDP